MLPNGLPDGLGEDDRLAGVTLSQRVMVFFADTRDGLYQIESWYEPLRALDATEGVVVVCMDSRTATQIREKSGLSVVTIAQDATLEGLLERSEIRLCLYVNHNSLNFIPLRFRSVAHVSLLHGDSDKVVSVSNQVKAYDFAFVAGDAGKDRLAQHVPFFDAEAHCKIIGRPQLGDIASEQGASPGRPAVLYAPTWEGAGPTVAYSSVAGHGLAIVRSLLASELVVVYRPHPLTGVRDGGFGDADQRIRAAIGAAIAADPDAGHRVSLGSPLARDFAAADLLVTDVSAVVNDWLPTGKPLIVTEPSTASARVTRSPLLDVVARLSPDAADGTGALVRAQLANDPARPARIALIDYYLGDTTPGAATQTFLRACADVIARRDREWARVTGDGERS